MSPLLALMIVAVPAALAGRALPMESENYVIGLFQRVNPYIEWDPTNFLVDLSGQYANCKTIGQQGSKAVDRQTPEGASIGGLVDYGAGSETHTDAVNKYIRDIMADWAYDSQYTEQIKRADTFGCSVQPGCSGQVSVACVFSPQYSGDRGGNPGDSPGEQYALAFTEDQYTMAEQYLGTAWDRSHFLENLSGFETSCSMINLNLEEFAFAKEKARERNMHIEGLYGSTPLQGDTSAAIGTILRGWKQVYSQNIGCSVIPDCKPFGGETMYVVVSCLFEIPVAAMPKYG